MNIANILEAVTTKDPYVKQVSIVSSGNFLYSTHGMRYKVSFQDDLFHKEMFLQIDVSKERIYIDMPDLYQMEAEYFSNSMRHRTFELAALSKEILDEFFATHPKYRLKTLLNKGYKTEVAYDLYCFSDLNDLHTKMHKSNTFYLFFLFLIPLFLFIFFFYFWVEIDVSFHSILFYLKSVLFLILTVFPIALASFLFAALKHEIKEWKNILRLKNRT